MPGTIKIIDFLFRSGDFPLPASFPQPKVALEASRSISRLSREGREPRQFKSSISYIYNIMRGGRSLGQLKSSISLPVYNEWGEPGTVKIMDFLI